MNPYCEDIYFVSDLDYLSKIKDRKIFVKHARALESYVIAKNNKLLAYKLAIEIDNRGLKTSRLENFIINGNPKYILKFAKEIRKANIKKCQSMIIRHGSILQIAKFGCFVRGAQRSVIEKLVVAARHPKSAYYYIKYVRTCDVNKLKHIIFESKKPRYLFALARVLNNKNDLDKIQNLIINSPSHMYVRLYAIHIKNADIKRLEDRIIKSNNIDEMKKFSKAVKSPRLSKLALLF